MPQKTMADYRREMEEKAAEEAKAKELEQEADKRNFRREAGKNLKESWVGKAQEKAKSNKVDPTIRNMSLSVPGLSGLLDMYEKFGESSPESVGRGIVDLSAQSPRDQESNDTLLRSGKGLAELIATYAGMGSASPLLKVPFALGGALEGFNAPANDYGPLAGSLVMAGSNKLLNSNKALQSLFSMEGNNVNQSRLQKIGDVLGVGGYNFLEGMGIEGARQMAGPRPLSLEDMLQAGTIGGGVGMVGRGLANSFRGSAKRTPRWAEDKMREETGKYNLPQGLDEDAEFLGKFNNLMAAEQAKYPLPATFERDKMGDMTKRSISLEMPTDDDLNSIVAKRMPKEVEKKVKEHIDQFKKSPGYKNGIKNLVAQGKTPIEAEAEMDKQAMQLLDQMGGRQLIEQDLAGSMKKQVLRDYVDTHNKNVDKFRQEFDEYTGKLRHKDVQIDKINPETYELMTKTNEKKRYVGLDRNGNVTELTPEEYGKLNPKVQGEYQEVSDIQTPFRIGDKGMQRALNVREEAATNAKALETNWAHQFQTNKDYQRIFNDTIRTGGINAPNVPSEVQSKIVTMLRSTSDPQAFATTMLEKPANLKAFNYYAGNSPEMMELGRRQFSRAIVENSFKPPKVASNNTVPETLFDKLGSVEKKDFEQLMGEGSYDRLKDLAQAQKSAWEHVVKTGFNPQSKEVAMPMLFLTWGLSKAGALASSAAPALGFAAVGAFKGINAYSNRHVHVMQQILESDGKIAKALKEYWAAPEKKARLGSALTKSIAALYEDSPDADAIDRATEREQKK